MTIRLSAIFGVVALACAMPSLHAQGVEQAAQAKRLPDRLLTCAIRHIINFDPSKQQTEAELKHDSIHRFSLFLPGIAKRTSPPPEPFEKAEPVNPRTRIIDDPDGIAPQPGHRFERVVDYWPDRVELASTIAGPLLNVIVISPVDTVHGTANLFMTRASELTHVDAKHIYQGRCNVQVTAPRSARGAV